MLALGCSVGLLWRPRPQVGEFQTAADHPARVAGTRSATNSGTAGGKPFHWAMVESADYQTYVANLRAIGCPEQTVRDIILADVNQLFAPRYAALSRTAPELAWWGRFNKRKPARAGLIAQLRALDDEKKVLLQRLLGSGGLVDFSPAASTIAQVRDQSTFAFLPESKRADVRELVSRYQALEEWSATQWKGLPTDERDARQKELIDERSRELAAFLTPEEMREFDLRNSATSDTLREQYGQANLSEEEFRKLYQLRQDFEQRNPEPKPEDWNTLESAIASALGPARLAEVQQQNDPMWNALQAIAPDLGLSVEGLQQAYAIEREISPKMIQAVAQMFADPDQNPQPLRDLSAEMEARLAAVLGEAAVRRLDSLGALPRLVIQDDGTHKTYSFSPGAFGD